MSPVTANTSANDNSVLGEDGTDGVTRYRQLASVIRHKIVSGEYPIGHQLPTVDAMAQSHGIAKVTVRQAFALLAEEGLISSQRGRGTHVIKAPSGFDERLRAAINDDAVGAADLEIRILEKRDGVSLPTALSRFGKAHDTYAMVRKLHIQDGAPFCVIEMYVATSVYARFPRGGERRHKLVQLLRQVVGNRMGATYMTLTVEPADYVLVRDLGYIFGAPVAKMARSILDVDGNVLMAGFFWYRGDRFVLDVALPATLSEHYPELTIPEARR